MPLVDIHCHLLANLDDGPESLEEAIAMCHVGWDDGIRSIAATAHFSSHWPEVSADSIRHATGQLKARLREIGLPLNIYPSAEVMVRPDLPDAWRRGELMGVADRKTYILIEFPPGVFFDLRETIRRLRDAGVIPILAHPERYAELLHDPGVIETLIQLGCLVQVTASSVTEPSSQYGFQALKRWVQRGVVHFIASDGHSEDGRRPTMSAAYRQVAAWAGPSVADRLCSLHGLAVLDGRPLRLAQPERRKHKWFSFFSRA